MINPIVRYGYTLYHPDRLAPGWTLTTDKGAMDGLYSSQEAAEKAYTLEEEVLDRIVKEARTTDYMGIVTMELIDKYDKRSNPCETWEQWVDEYMDNPEMRKEINDMFEGKVVNDED